MQLGTLLKAFISVIICGVALFIIAKSHSPTPYQVAIACSVVLAIPILANMLSFILHSARLYCNVEILKYDDASYESKISILAYWLCFEVLVYICAICDIICLIYITKQLAIVRESLNMFTRQQPSRASHASSATISTTSNSSQSTKLHSTQIIYFVNRLKFYPIAFVIGWFPNSLSLFVILITGKDEITLRMIANASAGLTGFTIAMNYFYFQYDSTAKNSTRQNTGITQSYPNSKSTSKSIGLKDTSVSSSSQLDKSDCENVNPQEDSSNDSVNVLHANDGI
jgi:hypothetical protein